MSQEIPEPWASAMRKADMTDPRNGKRLSMRRLADKAETTTTTISAMIYGRRDTRPEIVELVAEKLGVPVQTVFEWVRMSRTEARPFTPHRDAALLDSEERDAVNELIRLLARSKRQGGAEVHEMRPRADEKRASMWEVQDEAAREDEKGDGS